MGKRAQITALFLLALSACRQTQPLKPAAPRTVVLRWEASPKAISYNIYRAKPGALYQKIGSSGTTVYTDPQVPGRTSFFYVVTAVNENGESEPSKRLEVSIP